MTNIEFRTVLEAAVSGDRKALDTLLSRAYEIFSVK